MKRYLLIIGVWIGVFCFASSPASYAAPGPLDVQIEVSYGGEIKWNEWYPVKFTVTNPGEDVNGQLVLEIMSQSSGNNIAYAQELELPQNSTKIVWMAIPGIVLNESNNRVMFYAGSIDSGRTIPFNRKDVYVQVSAQPREALQVGVLSANKDTLNFLALLNQDNVQVNVVSLRQDSLPEHSIMLEALDYLVVNNFPSSELSEQQVKAIGDWVRQGGSLLLAGGAAYPASAEAFSELSPIEYQGTISLQELPSLSELAESELSFRSPFTLSKGEVRGGDLLITEQDIPLFVSKQVGKGKVMYAAYDLSLDPLASWSGNRALWTYVLSNDLRLVNTLGADRYNDYWTINNALDLFEGLRPPALGQLLLFFMFYVLLVAPVLYWILKWRDRREWAWAIIPAIAIVSSIGIFLLGTADRNQTLAQTLNLIELDGQGQGLKSSYSAVFMPRGGKYDIQLDENLYAAPFAQNQYNLNNTNDQIGQFDQIIFQRSGGQSVQFWKVPYSSIRKFQTMDNTSQVYGQFEVELQAEGNVISGELTNRTGQALQDVSIMMYSQIHIIGDLAAEETTSFQLTLHPGYGHRGMSHQMVQTLYPYQGGNEFEHERALLTTAIENRFYNLDMARPLIIGTSKEKASFFTVNGERIEASQLNLWLQELEYNYVQGDQIWIPAGSILPVITKNELTFLDNDPYNGILFLGEGQFTFEYRLPQIQDGMYTEANIEAWSNEFESGLQIWNKQTGEWVAYTALQAGVLSEEFIDERVIRMQYINHRDHLNFQYPQLSAKGRVSP